MTQPLALVFYEKLLPGTQIVNRLQDEGWRVQTVNDPAALVPAAEEHHPLLAFADLDGGHGSAISESIAALRGNAGTAHIPVIAISAAEAQRTAATAAGATLAVGDTVVVQHLKQFIDQALGEF